MRRAAFLIGALLGLGAPAAPAQDTLRLSVADAIARGRVAHPALIEARARRDAGEAAVLASRAGYFPRLSAEYGLIRTDDPVAVFGSRLRQGRFMAADLALEALNYPSPVTNTSVGLTIEQPLVAPEAWLGRKTALAGAEAARLFEERASQQGAFDILRAYFGAQLMAERVGTMDSLLRAAVRTLDQVRAFRREGLVTSVDEQLALARVSELEASRALADAEHVAAIGRLLALIGEDPRRPAFLVDPLDQPGRPPSGLDPRPDLAGLEAMVRAGDANVDRTRAQWLPTAAAFGGLGWNQGTVGGFSGPRRWTAGVLVRWSLFRGFADVAAVEQARAERRAAADRLEAARRGAEAEVQAATAQVEAALAALRASERALEHATEAVRVAESRYAGGVAAITELLAVRAAEASHRLARLEASYQARLAGAALTLARGGTPE